MSLEAHIACNCFLKGKTKPFPAPGFEQYFVYEEGWWHMNIPDPQYETLENEVERWKEIACEHKDMLYYSQQIMGWGSVGTFEWIMERLGREKFPVFFGEFENMHGHKETSVETATHMLTELAIFEKQESLGEAYFLMREDQSEPVLDSIGGDVYITSVLADTTSFEYGFDEGDFFIAQKDGKRLFQANRFKINLVMIPGKPFNYGHTIEYKALDSNQQYVGKFFSPFPFRRYWLPFDRESVNQSLATDASYYVVKHPIAMDRFDHAIASFRAILKASLEAEMPIAWDD